MDNDPRFNTPGKVYIQVSAHATVVTIHTNLSITFQITFVQPYFEEAQKRRTDFENNTDIRRFMYVRSIVA